MAEKVRGIRKMIVLFGEEREPIAPKKGRMKRKTMQETYGILDGVTCGQFNCGCRA